jgi:tRNA pseudouridine38-40 synthase
VSARRTLKVTLAYDGTEFYGWQVQSRGRTVQAVVEAALGRMHETPVRVAAAGRTDSGVHATGQVISFESGLSSIAPERFPEALNSYLPSDVRAMDAEAVPDRFDARRSACLRVYRYYVSSSAVLAPHLRRYCLWRRRRARLADLNALAAPILGTHDFSTFSSADDANETKVRTAVSSCFHVQGDMLVYTIAADRFLRRMVRSIVGTLLDMESRDAAPSELAAALDARDRSLAGPTAPARGLFLEKVIYNDEPGIAF